MTDSIFGDYSYMLARLALDGLSKRQLAISSNIANVDTPGYQSQTVDFQSVLKKAFSSSESMNLETTNSLHLESTTEALRFAAALRPGGTARADGNNVDIDVELVDMSETNINYETISQAVSLRLQLLKTIAQSR
jgi:flagellar basal-body rod protein FlgB